MIARTSFYYFRGTFLREGTYTPQPAPLEIATACLPLCNGELPLCAFPNEEAYTLRKKLSYKMIDVCSHFFFFFF